MVAYGDQDFGKRLVTAVPAPGNPFPVSPPTSKNPRLTHPSPTPSRPEAVRLIAGFVTESSQTGIPDGDSGRAYATLWIQPNGSGLCPYWRPTSSYFSRRVTGPGVPSAIVQPPDGAVHRADRRDHGRGAAARRPRSARPEAQSSRQWVTETRPSSAGMPSVGASLSSESRVMPGSSEPVSSGVTSRADSPDPYTKYRFCRPFPRPTRGWSRPATPPGRSPCPPLAAARRTRPRSCRRT